MPQNVITRPVEFMFMFTFYVSVSLVVTLFLMEIIHTYINNYNHSVRIIDLVSHTTYVASVNFIHQWRDL